MYEMEGALPGREVARQPVAWPPRHPRAFRQGQVPASVPSFPVPPASRSFLRAVPVSGSEEFLPLQRGAAQGFSGKSSRVFLSTWCPQKTASYAHAAAVIHRIINSSSTGYRMSPEYHRKAIISPVAAGTADALICAFPCGRPCHSGGLLGL